MLLRTSMDVGATFEDTWIHTSHFLSRITTSTTITIAITTHLALLTYNYNSDINTTTTTTMTMIMTINASAWCKIIPGSIQLIPRFEVIE